MAKRDVNLYYLQVQNDYFEMLENLKEFKDLAERGSISQEEYTSMLNQVELVRNNYERISYIMLLLNKPRRKSKEDADMNKSWYAALSGASKEAILDENRDALADLKAILRREQERKEEK